MLFFFIVAAGFCPKNLVFAVAPKNNSSVRLRRGAAAILLHIIVSSVHFRLLKPPMQKSTGPTSCSLAYDWLAIKIQHSESCFKPNLHHWHQLTACFTSHFVAVFFIIGC